MKIRNYDISVSPDIEWKQLAVLWNKKIQYNWYNFTFIRFCWSFTFRKNKEELQERIGSKINPNIFPKTYIEIILGFLGFNFTFFIIEEWDDDKK